MAQQFYTILTQVGAAKIANAVSLGTSINVTQLAVGDGNGAYYNPMDTQTALVHEVWRGSIQSLSVDSSNPNWIVVEVDIPSNVGGFTVREAAIFDDAGDMLAVGIYPETYKPNVSDGSAKDLYIKMIIQVSNASVITLKIDPSVVLATKNDISNLAGVGRTTETVKGNAVAIAAANTALAAHQADYVRQPGYSVATNSGNDYSVSTTPAPTSYIDGIGIAVKINANSTGNATINWNGLGAKNIVDSDGNKVSDLKANTIYSLKYESTSGNFIIQGKGGGSELLDSIVDQYIVSADGPLSAGDLCEFINGQIRKTSYSAGVNSLAQENSAGSSNIESVELDSSRILVIYTSTSNYMWAVILSVNGTAVTASSPIQINSTSSLYISTTLLDSSRVLVSYMGVGNYLYSVILSINNSVITAGTPTQINSVSYSEYSASALLDESHVLVCYALTSNNYLYAVVLTIDGMTITVGTITQTNGRSAAYINIIVLDENHALVSFCSSNYVYAIILTISGTVITNIGTVTQVSTVSNVNYLSAVALDEEHVLLSYGSSTGGYLYAIVLLISNYVIMIGASTTINGASVTYISSAVVDSTHALIICRNSADSYLYGIVLEINQLVISFGLFTKLNTINTSYCNCIPLGSNNVMINYAGTTNSYLYSMIVNVSDTTISSTIVTHSKKPYVVCPESASVGSVVKGILKGIVSGLSGLIPNNTYYCDDNGNLTEVQTRVGENPIGVALSATDLLIRKGFWER